MTRQLIGKRAMTPAEKQHPQLANEPRGWRALVDGRIQDRQAWQLERKGCWHKAQPRFDLWFGREALRLSRPTALLRNRLTIRHTGKPHGAATTPRPRDLRVGYRLGAKALCRLNLSFRTDVRVRLWSPNPASVMGARNDGYARHRQAVKSRNDTMSRFMPCDRGRRTEVEARKGFGSDLLPLATELQKTLRARVIHLR
jgi:hypothetical protein